MLSFTQHAHLRMISLVLIVCFRFSLNVEIKIVVFMWVLLMKASLESNLLSRERNGVSVCSKHMHNALHQSVDNFVMV